MSALKIYKEMLRRGFVFQVKGDRLKISGTREELTPELTDKLKSNKPEIMAYVSEWQSGGPFLQPNGSLVIPSSSDPKYHWWNGGMHLTEIRNELLNHPVYGPWHYQFIKKNV